MASPQPGEWRASEIERLADLQGFLKFASIPDWMRVSLSYVSYPTIDRPKRAASAALTPEPTPVARVPEAAGVRGGGGTQIEQTDSVVLRATAAKPRDASHLHR
jgi:hypothetical protein